MRSYAMSTLAKSQLQIIPKLAIGFGINADKVYRSELSSVVGNLLFKQTGQSWAYGWTTVLPIRRGWAQS